MSKRALGYAVVAAGTFYKVPQVLKLHRAKSAKGVSAVMSAADAVSTLVEIAFNVHSGNPYSSWGEMPSQLICASIITFQCLWYRRIKRNALYAAGTLWVCLIVVCLRLSRFIGRSTATRWLGAAKSMNVFLTISSKIPQILSMRRGPSQLSVTTTALALLGNIVRVYTGIEYGVKMYASQAASLVLNSIILSMALRSKRSA